MQVDSSLNIAAAERVIREMQGRVTDTTLTLPTRSRANVGGGEPAIVQAVLTWAATQETARISSYAIGAEDAQLDTLTGHLPGLCATLVCDRAEDLSGGDITGPLKELALERLRGLQGPTPQRWSRGAQLEVLCADHLGWSTPQTLYATEETPPRLLSRTEFDRIAELLMERTLADHPAADDQQLKIGLADALYELFRNTDLYARSDDRGNQVGKSIRGIHARRQSISRSGLAKMVEASRPLADYCDRLFPRGERRDIQLLEVSVFDAGPGYAAHWLGRPLAAIQPDEELAAIRTCFEKHATRRNHSTAGMGLCTVVDILRRRSGFLRLRTGRHSLFADLASERELAYGTPPQRRSTASHRPPGLCSPSYCRSEPCRRSSCTASTSRRGRPRSMS